jgi:hypothetical protein
MKGCGANSLGFGPITRRVIIMVSEEVKGAFRELLHNGRVHGSPAVIANRFQWQTRLATLELLEHAIDKKAEVRILTGTATEYFYRDDVVRRLGSCAKANCKIRMLIWNDKSGAVGDDLRDLVREHAGKFEIRRSGTRTMGAEMSHFLLVGEEAYRLEQPHDYFEKNQKFDEFSPEAMATIVFRDASGGQALAEHFNQLWDWCPAEAAVSA